MKIFESIKINKYTAKNRIMLPPVVLFGVDTKDGEVGGFRMEHYESFAKNNVGTVVVEAVAVNKDYIITPCQIGAYDDKFVPELSLLAEKIKKRGSIAVAQIQHAGGKPYAPINENPFGPSDMNYIGHKMRKATVSELEEACEDFIKAAVRLKKAGFDGAEIHNAHGYLLTQMCSPLINTRDDDYGGTQEKRMKLSLDILKGIRQECGGNFIIGVRFGANEPSYEDGIAIAKMYEDNGIDYLSVSHGYHFPSREDFDVPKDFPYNAIVYGGTKIKENIKEVPVILVNHIQNIADGEWLLERGLGDMIAYARPLLAANDMIRRFREGKKDGICLYCSRCKWTFDPIEQISEGKFVLGCPAKAAENKK